MLALAELDKRFPVVTPTLKLPPLAPHQLRLAADGWHVVVSLGGVQHRLWLQTKPLTRASYTVLLPYDREFKVRHEAADRLWRALKGRPLGPTSDGWTEQRRARLVLTLRAVDAWQQGNNYRAIADALFGAGRISARSWKTHDLRSRTRRLVQSGLSLIRGGYLQLLRPRRKDE
ncbi:DUF2285 domain-containing protein [Bradyrhizobium sp. BTAi1]|uniref:DUF2285 domain-containing protein n=1 Tax=Bradyrhizobium sp. (strain BTAi1 / ATCC BAA-1182) TaxID=288000 RepID=UPI00005E0014|nr:DUF2285 domain-containing protein [Bradyrhizobium sp. BTAi1]ABQ35446.1 hypothetical protein BBta_3345 [Bradyrhizobium sp. BTAi1]